MLSMRATTRRAPLRLIILTQQQQQQQQVKTTTMKMSTTTCGPQRLNNTYTTKIFIYCSSKKDIEIHTYQICNYFMLLLSQTSYSLFRLQRFSEVPDHLGLAILSIIPGNPKTLGFLMENFNLVIGKIRYFRIRYFRKPLYFIFFLFSFMRNAIEGP